MNSAAARSRRDTASSTGTSSEPTGQPQQSIDTDEHLVSSPACFSECISVVSSRSSRPIAAQHSPAYSQWKAGRDSRWLDVARRRDGSWRPHSYLCHYPGVPSQAGLRGIGGISPGKHQWLLARHPNDCMRCEVNGSCGFRNPVSDYQLGQCTERTDRTSGAHTHELHVAKHLPRSGQMHCMRLVRRGA